MPHIVTFLATHVAHAAQCVDCASPTDALQYVMSLFRTQRCSKALIAVAEVAAPESSVTAQTAYTAFLSEMAQDGLYVTLTAQDLLRSSSSDGLFFEDFGAIACPLLGRSERIYAVLHPDLPEPKPEKFRRRGNCPRLQRRFVGRHAQIARLEDALGLRRLISITGPPGVGKTALAARALRGLPPDTYGAWWFSVSDCTSLEDLIGKIRRQDELCTWTGRPDLEDTAAKLATLDDVIVLDGCDHLIAEVGELCRRLLELSSSVTVLVTCRSPLNVPGEWRLPLGPLDLPHREREGESPFGSEALELFLERAEEVGYPVTQADLHFASFVCELVDGVPLAIEMLAGSLGETSLPRLAADLGRTYTTGEPFPTLAAESAMNSAYSSAFAALSQDEREMLLTLALFQGQWDVSTVTAIWGGWRFDASRIPQLHESLLRRSWIAADREERTFRMLRPLRHFVRAQVDSTNGQEHTARLTALLQDLGGCLYDAGRRQDREILIRHYPDFLAALERSMEEPRCSEYIPALTKNLIPCWSRMNLLGDATRLCTLAVRQLDGIDALRARNMLGIAAMRLGHHLQAESHFKESIRLARTCNSAPAEAAAMSNLAMLESSVGQYDSALAHYDEAVAVLRMAAQPRLLAIALTNSANTRVIAADAMGLPGAGAMIDEARIQLEEATSLAEEDPGILQAVTYNIGRLALWLGDLREAERQFRKAIAICEDARIEHEAYESVNGLAFVAERAQKIELAAKFVGLAKAILVRSGHFPSDDELTRTGHLLKLLRSRLGAERCEKLVRYGGRLTLDEVANYVAAQ